MKDKALLGWGFLVTFLLGGVLFFHSEREGREFLIIGNEKWKIEVAKTPKEQERGLGYRSALPEKTGMLFLIDPPQKRTFWMKGMEFSLDMVFIRDGRVTQVEREIPATSKDIFPSIELVDMVLEVNAGEAKNITPGMPVFLK